MTDENVSTEKGGEDREGKALSEGEVLQALREKLKVKSVWVELGYTKNIGHYESIKLGAGVKAEISGNEMVKPAFKNLWKECREQLRSQLQEVASKKAAGDNDAGVSG